MLDTFGMYPEGIREARPKPNSLVFFPLPVVSRVNRKRVACKRGKGGTSLEGKQN